MNVSFFYSLPDYSLHLYYFLLNISTATIRGKCIIPTAVPNAQIAQKSFNDGAQPRTDDFVVFQCQQHYKTDDPLTAVCGANGTWSRFPTCTRVVFCPLISDIANGQMIDKTWSRQSPQKGDTATFRCNEGAELRGNPLVVCKIDGTWSAMPTCESMSIVDIILYNYFKQLS